MNTLLEKYVQLQMDYRNARADVDALTARVVELEQLLSEYHDFVAGLDPRYGFGVIRIGERNSLQQRARVLLHEGQSDPAKEEPK